MENLGKVRLLEFSETDEHRDFYYETKYIYIKVSILILFMGLIVLGIGILLEKGNLI